MMWRLVRSSWILHVNNSKRRVVSIAALLSSVLHTCVFADEGMHLIDDEPGPLKWVCNSSCVNVFNNFPCVVTISGPLYEDS